MTGKGHFATGIAFSLISFDYTNSIGGYGIISAFACIIGVNAPDYLEMWRKKYDINGKYLSSVPRIQHRTITHIVLLWALLLLFSYINIQGMNGDISSYPKAINYFSINHLFEPNIYYNAMFSFLFGYAIGGNLHLLTDLPNPKGIPLIFPKKRFSLNLWKSGRFEPAIILFFIMLNFFYFDIIQLNGDWIDNIKNLLI